MPPASCGLTGATGEDRFRIMAAGCEQIVTGFEESEGAEDALVRDVLGGFDRQGTAQNRTDRHP